MPSRENVHASPRAKLGDAIVTARLWLADPTKSAEQHRTARALLDAAGEDAAGLEAVRRMGAAPPSLSDVLRRQQDILGGRR